MLIFQFKTFANCFLKVIIQRRLSESPQTRLNLCPGVAVGGLHNIILEKKIRNDRGALTFIYNHLEFAAAPRERKKKRKRIRTATSDVVTGFIIKTTNILLARRAKLTWALVTGSELTK